MNRKIAFLFLGALFLSSCSKEDEEMDLTKLLPPVAEKKEKEIKASTKEVVPEYSYPYSEERDPFVPLIGGSKGGKRTSRDSQRSFENFSQLTLKGILQDPDGPVALISSSDGETFRLKNGVVFDRRNKKMNGISGNIKGNKVTLNGPNNSTKTFSLK